MPKPRPWPNAAKADRDDSARDAAAGIRQLQPIATGADMSQANILIRVMKAINYFLRILVRMRDQGADVDIPEDYYRE